MVPLLAISQPKEKKETRKERIAKEQEKTKKLQKDAEEGAIIFNKQSSFHIALRSDGYGISYEHGKFKKVNKTNLWWVSLGERKDTKEEKNLSFLSQRTGIGNSFIYGKQNNFYMLNIGFGQQRQLGGKGGKNGISVSAIYGGGLSIGMLKPYYLDVLDSSRTYIETIKYQDNNDSRFLDNNYIIGAAAFGKGYGEMKFVPGFFTKGAVRFDYGKFNDIISALEIGINAEFYTQKMPIMIANKNKNFFVSGYVSIIFGTRK